MKKLTTLFLLFPVLFYSACNSDDNSRDSDSLSITLTEVFTIQSEEENEDTWLIRPDDIVTDSEGNIYVSDTQQKAIMKFTPEGSFIRKIGREGRGPGEFPDILNMHLFNDTLVVFSRSGQKFILLDTEGSFIADYTPENTILNEFELLKTPGGYVKILSEYSTDSDKSALKLFQPLDNTFQNAGEKSVSYTFVYQRFDEHIYNLSGLVPGFFTLVKNDAIIAVPDVYEGWIYKFMPSTDETGWVKSDSLRTADLTDFYTVFSSQKENITDRIHFSVEGGRNYYRVHSQSNGLFAAKADTLVHFFHRDEGNTRWFGAELFTADLKYLGMDTLLTDQNVQDSIRVVLNSPVHVDQRNRVYFVEYDDQNGLIVSVQQLGYRE